MGTQTERATLCLRQGMMSLQALLTIERQRPSFQDTGRGSGGEVEGGGVESKRAYTKGRGMSVCLSVLLQAKLEICEDTKKVCLVIVTFFFLISFQGKKDGKCKYGPVI